MQRERLDKIIFLLNGNNVYDNRIKNILQFLNPQICIKGQYVIKPDNNNTTVVCSANNQNLLKLVLDGYQITYKQEDVLFWGKEDYGQRNWHPIDATFLELGGNATVNQEEIRSRGKQGHFILTHRYNLNEGDYRFKIILNRAEGDNINPTKEVGFVYVTGNDVEIARENIYVNDMSDEIVTICPLSLDEPDQKIQFNVYLYDNVDVSLDGVYICSDY